MLNTAAFLILLFLAAYVGAECRWSYFQRLRQYENIHSDPVVRQLYFDFATLCSHRAFARDAVHFLPLPVSLTDTQKESLLALLHREDWNATVVTARILRAEQFSGAFVVARVKDECHCAVLSTDATDDNSTHYRRLRGVPDFMAGLMDPVGREIHVISTRLPDVGWGIVRCQCAAEALAPLDLLRLDTRAFVSE
jgi:hypothetical protein